MALNVYIRKEKMLKTNDLNFHSKKLVKGGRINHQTAIKYKYMRKKSVKQEGDIQQSNSTKKLNLGFSKTLVKLINPQKDWQRKNRKENVRQTNNKRVL